MLSNLPKYDGESITQIILWYAIVYGIDVWLATPGQRLTDQNWHYLEKYNRESHAVSTFKLRSKSWNWTKIFTFDLDNWPQRLHNFENWHSSMKAKSRDDF